MSQEPKNQMNAFIKQVHGGIDTGGGGCADVIELTSGRCIVIGDECLSIYPSFAAFDADQLELPENAYLFEVFARLDAPYAFVAAIDTDERGSPAPVDLVTLHDGRVIGIDGETVVLYPNREAFDAIARDGDTIACPALLLAAKEVV